MSPARIERRVLIAGILIIAAVLVVALSTAVAGAQGTPTEVLSVVSTSTATAVIAAPSVTTTPSATGDTGSFALDFTLPTFGKSGCMVCHGDPNLVIAQGDVTKSFWIDEAAYNKSAHATVVCAGCHIDYGYKAPHSEDGQDWRAVAKQSCKNCHPDQFRDWSQGAHALAPLAGKQPDPKAAFKPLCGDCHGSHDMAILKNNPANQAAIRKTSQQMCGRVGCHPDYWDNYSDYYHGAAYKTSAEDAPACWTCHGTHAILKSTDRFATTNVDNLGAANSCGTPGCHQDANAAYAAYAPMIHGRAKITAENPVARFINSVLGR